MKKGPELTAEKTAVIFRKIAEIIDNNPSLLASEGVFRLSADARVPPEIINKILKKKNITNDKYTIYDLTGTLKLALKDNILIDAKDPRIANLQKVAIANAVGSAIIKPNNNPYQDTFSNRGDYFAKKRTLNRIIDRLETNLLTLDERLKNGTITQIAHDAVASNIKIDIHKRQEQLAKMSAATMSSETAPAVTRAKSIRHSVVPNLSDSRKRIEKLNPTDNEKIKKAKGKPA